MSMSDAAENALLALIFQNANWANVGDATGLRGSTVPGNLYVALHTADPTDTGSQTSFEAAYSNYARQAVVRSAAGWTIAGTNPTNVSNAALIEFPTAGATGVPETITHFSVGVVSSGASQIIVSGALNSSLVVNEGVQPRFQIGDLDVNAD